MSRKEIISNVASHIGLIYVNFYWLTSGKASVRNKIVKGNKLPLVERKENLVIQDPHTNTHAVSYKRVSPKLFEQEEVLSKTNTPGKKTNLLLKLVAMTINT